MQTPFSATSPAPYPPGYFPQETAPRPPLPPPPSQPYHHNGYSQPLQRPPLPGEGGYTTGAGQPRRSSPPFIPLQNRRSSPPFVPLQNRRSSPPFAPPLPPHNPSLPQPSYNSGAPHVYASQPLFDPRAYSMRGEFNYGPASQPLQGYATRNSPGAEPHAVPYGSQPGHAPAAYPTPMVVQSFHHGLGADHHAGAPPASASNVAGTIAHLVPPGARYFHPAPVMPPFAAHPAPRPTSGPPSHGPRSPDPWSVHVPAPNDNISSTVPEGRIPPPHDGFLFDTFGSQISKEEQRMVWNSLTELDQRRLLSEWHKPQQATPASAVGSDAHSQTGSASAPGRRSKGKVTATHASATSGGGSYPPGGAPASGTYRSPYVEDTFDADGSFAGTQTYEHSGSTSFRPAAHYQRHTVSREPALPQGVPTTPQGNHFGVVVLDAINGLAGKVDNIGTLFGGFVESHPMNRAPGVGGYRPMAGSRPSPTQDGGRATTAHAYIDDGYTADEEEDEEEREEKRLKAELEAQKTRDRPYHLQLMRSVRRHVMYMLLNVKSTKELPKRYPPHTPEQIAAYNRGECPPIGKDNFRPDFVAGWKTGDYNRDARRFCIEGFIRELKGGLYSEPPLPARFTRHDVVLQAIDNHMDYLRREYKAHAAPMTAQHAEWLEHNQERKRVNARRSTTYKVRVWTINRHRLVQHRKLFDILKPCHMSADEAEVEDEYDDRQKHPRVYIIVDAAWQSRQFKIFVRTLESWNIADWRQSVKSRLPSGNAPRTRVEKGVTRVVDSKAPEGLWRNCYSQAWLDSLPGHVRARLNLIDSDYDFSLPTYKKPAYIDPKEFPVPEEEDEAMEEEDEADVSGDPAVGGAA